MFIGKFISEVSISANGCEHMFISYRSSDDGYNLHLSFEFLWTSVRMWQVVVLRSIVSPPHWTNQTDVENGPRCLCYIWKYLIRSRQRQWLDLAASGTTVTLLTWISSSVPGHGLNSTRRIRDVRKDKMTFWPTVCPSICLVVSLSVSLCVFICLSVCLLDR